MKKIIKYLFIFVLAFLGFIAGTMQVEANNSITITNAGTRRGGIGSPYFVSSVAKYTTQCGHGHLLPPFAYNVPTTVKFSDLEEITDQATRKVAYYGWGGPKEWSGLANINVMTLNGWDYGVAPRNTAGYHATHWALNNAWHNVNPKAGNSKSFEAELQPFTDYLSTQADAPQGYKVYVYKTGAGAQDLIIYSNESVESQLTLKKTSANKNLTEIATAGYSLAGAEYGVYASEVNAQRDQSRLATLTTDVDGNSNAVSLTMNQTYYVKEVKAPKGFYLDTDVHSVYLDSDKTIHVEDKPKFDPLVLMLRKNDGNGKLLEGAHFEVKYYAGAFDTVESLANQSALKTWVFKTNAEGKISFKDEYRISGDELFKSSSGNPVGLIGTYTFKEIKAPQGYVLDSTVYISQVKEDGTATDPNGDGTIYNAPIISNNVIRGNLQVLKVAEHDTSVNLEGVTFELRKGNDVIATQTTNANGIARFENIEYGNYTLVETKTVEDYVLPKDNTRNITINQNNQTIQLVILNEKTPEIKTQAHGEGQQVREAVEPKDKQIITETANFKDLVIGESYKALLELVDLATKKVVQTREVEFIATATEMTLTENFEVNGFEHVEGVTFSEDLFRKNQKGEWELKATHNKNYEDKDQTITFKKYGKLTVKKVDANDQATVLVGAEFTLYRDGIEIAKGVSGKDGIVVFEKLIEGVEYELKETNAPVGYLLPKESKKITLTAEQLEKEEVFEVPNSLLPVIKKNIKTSSTVNFMVYIAGLIISVFGMWILKNEDY